MFLHARPAPSEAQILQAPGGVWGDTAAKSRTTGSILVIREGLYVRLVKPVIDRAIALLMLVVLAPLVCGLLLTVRIKLGAPAIFRQERVGRDSRPFTIYKVRTMLVDTTVHAATSAVRDLSAAVVGTVPKSATDPRHTPLGRVLRKLSLDELPQLWNVVRGDMSLVGPRPEMIAMVERNDLWHHPRHLARPGLTGAWQVSPDRDRPIHENLHHDLDYVTRVTFLGDMRILVKTAACVLGCRGS